jgi:hypothetical protein
LFSKKPIGTPKQGFSIISVAVAPLKIIFEKGGAELHPLFQKLKKGVQFSKSPVVRAK